MASQHHLIKNGSRGNGAKHARYVAGEGRYADRDDVLYLEDGNLPNWAKDAVDFFAAADEFERGDHTRTCKTRSGEEYQKTIKGRVYKEMEVGIPREATDPVKWAKDFARESIGKKHPYRLAIHDKQAADGGRNIHMHLVFSTRTMDGYDRDKETFFKRAAAPYRDRKTKELVQPNPGRGGAKKSTYWDSQVAIHEHRARFERSVQKVVPGFTLERSDAPEQKIGPKLEHADEGYEMRRAIRAENVAELRWAKREKLNIDLEIKREKEIEERLIKAKELGQIERRESNKSIIDLGVDINDAKIESRSENLYSKLEAKIREQDSKKQGQGSLAERLNLLDSKHFQNTASDLDEGKTKQNLLQKDHQNLVDEFFQKLERQKQEQDLDRDNLNRDSGLER